MPGNPSDSCGAAGKDRNYLLNALPEDMAELVEDVRLGKKN